MDKREEGLGEFVVARGDAPEMLEASEEALDQIASAVEMAVELARCQSIGARRNHDLGARRFDSSHKMIGVVALVGHHGLSRQILDQCRGVVDLTKLGFKNQLFLQLRASRIGAL